MPATAPFRVSDAQREQYRRDGYFVAERLITPEHLELLRTEVAEAIGRIDAEAAKRGAAGDGNHGGGRYFIANQYKTTGRAIPFLFADYMAEVCRATLGENAFLFWEQFVVKGPERAMKFGWHQDSGYLNFPHRPYITCWCALDDVDEANGTIYVLPWSRPGMPRQRIEHTRESGSNDMVGYHGDDPGIPIIAPAGTIAVFSSVTFHRSGANTTPKMRRAYTAHYSDSPILNPDGTLCAFADPIVRDGRHVSPPKPLQGE